MPSSSLLIIIYFFLFQIFFPNLITSHSCSSSLSLSTSSSSCPPFTSPLSFPFSSSPGCGHPFFQIQCSYPHSIITINNFNFSVLHHKPNSSSLTISLLQPSNLSLSTNNNTHHCSSTSSSFSLLSRPIDLSGSPFRFSLSTCSKLSHLRPCSPQNHPNCSLCSWECKLFKNPSHILNGCEPNQSIPDLDCKNNVFDSLQNFLKLGIQIEWDEHQDTYFSNCKSCQSKNGICGFNSSDSEKSFLCFQSKSQISTTPSWIYRDNPNRLVFLGTLLILICLVFVILITRGIIKSRVMKSIVTEEDPTTIFLHRHRSANLLPPVFSYEELESSTNLFDSRRKIGDGGFGSVYLGQLYDGRIVAVKKLHRNPSSSTKAFCNEILILSSIDHPNLVKLYGYCSDPRGLLLVYDYVSNGTLADHLHGCKSLLKKRSLNWQVRIEVALQTAMALEYLHFNVKPAIVHRDVTSSNIFLEKDMKIKVGDFGLSRLLIFSDSSSTSSSSSEYICTGPQGTPGYLDPDYHRSFRLTEKSDIYSFGVILFELISGMKAVDLSRDKREISLAGLVVGKIQVGLLHQVVDPVLILEGEAMGTVDSVAELGFRCVADDKDDRPDAKEIVTELKRIKNRTRGHRNSNGAP